jgi:hypothetical protein
MMPHLTPRQLARIAAVGFVVLIVALTIVRSRHSEQAVVLAPLEHGDADGRTCPGDRSLPNDHIR